MIAFLRHRGLRAVLAPVALATFLGASAADARGLDPCPHHDALNLARVEPDGGATAAAAPTHQHEHGAAHAEHAGHAHDLATGSDQGSDKAHEHGPCNCVGSCDAGGSPPLVARVPDVVVSLAPVAEIGAPAVAQGIVPRQNDGWTPYLPQAPPFPV